MSDKSSRTIQSRYWQRAIGNGRSILEIALNMRMAANGSADHDFDFICEAYWFLKDRLECWQESHGNRSIFDAGVKMLIQSAILEVLENEPRVLLNRKYPPVQEAVNAM